MRLDRACAPCGAGRKREGCYGTQPGRCVFDCVSGNCYSGPDGGKWYAGVTSWSLNALKTGQPRPIDTGGGKKNNLGGTKKKLGEKQAQQEQPASITRARGAWSVLWINSV